MGKNRAEAESVEEQGSFTSALAQRLPGVLWILGFLLIFVSLFLRNALTAVSTTVLMPSHSGSITVYDVAIEPRIQYEIWAEFPTMVAADQCVFRDSRYHPFTAFVYAVEDNMGQPVGLKAVDRYDRMPRTIGARLWGGEYPYGWPVLGVWAAKKATLILSFRGSSRVPVPVRATLYKKSYAPSALIQLACFGLVLVCLGLAWRLRSSRDSVEGARA